MAQSTIVQVLDFFGIPTAERTATVKSLTPQDREELKQLLDVLNLA